MSLFYYGSIPRCLLSSISLFLYVSGPLYLCSSLPLLLYVSVLLYLCFFMALSYISLFFPLESSNHQLGVRPNFFICGLEKLGLGFELNCLLMRLSFMQFCVLKIVFFLCIEVNIVRNPEKIGFNLAQVVSAAFTFTQRQWYSKLLKNPDVFPPPSHLHPHRQQVSVITFLYSLLKHQIIPISPKFICWKAPLLIAIKTHYNVNGWCTCFPINIILIYANGRFSVCAPAACLLIVI
jgi:hypothetical protein